jgi:prepilin-type N-terminal cleavage/methylation domain-containing protein
MSLYFKKENRRIQKDRIRGFSLVELMVSLSLFSTVMVISVGTLLVMININAKGQALYSSSTNLSFALDNMTRELRTGYHYFCDDAGAYYYTSLPEDYPSDGADNFAQDCSSKDFIAFTREWDSHRMGYRLANSAIEFREEQSDGTLVTDWTPITSKNIVVSTFDMTVKGAESFYDGNNTAQAVIDISVKGSAANNNGLDTSTDFNIQSHIVAHRLDVQ